MSNNKKNKKPNGNNANNNKPKNTVNNKTNNNNKTQGNRVNNKPNGNKTNNKPNNNRRNNNNNKNRQNNRKPNNNRQNNKTNTNKQANNKANKPTNNKTNSNQNIKENNKQNVQPIEPKKILEEEKKVIEKITNKVNNEESLYNVMEETMLVKPVINSDNKETNSTIPNGAEGSNRKKGKNRISDSIEKKKKKEKKQKKKRFTGKQKLIIALSIFLGLVLILGVVLGVYIFKAGGDVKEAVLNIATDIVGEQEPIFVLLLGVSNDISIELTDTIMLCGYNPKTQKAFMLSVPRDTYVGKNPAYANGYDKINAQYQKSAEKTVETVELLTGVNIDHYVIVRNISIATIFKPIGNIDFNVPIDMDYDDPTQNLHIHLKKGQQSLSPEQIEQLLRFRHNNNGISYPLSYGDNDYGRMRTQRDFIKAAMTQLISLQNVGKLKDVASYVYANLQTNMTGFQVLDYVPYALKFNTENLRSEQLPGQSALINDLWFYNFSKSKTRKLVDELMIYLELDDKALDKSYKYASTIKGIKPDQNWVSNEVIIDDDYSAYIGTKKGNNVDDEPIIGSEAQNPENCTHQDAVYDSINPTCENGGRTVYKCIKCLREKTDQTAPLGHKYVDGVCTRCKKADPKANSSNGSATNTGNTVGNTTGNNNTNTTNPDPIPENPPAHTTHDYSVELSRTPASCTAPGTATMKCSGCDLTQEKTLPALGHDFSNTSSPTCSRCSEQNPNYQEPTPEPPPVTPDPTPPEPTE